MPRLLLLLAAGLALATGAHAQTCSTEWAAPVDGDWDDQTKWTNGVPMGVDMPGGADPCIAVPGTYTVTIRPDYAVNINLQTFTLGGASGTQTLVSGGALILTDMTIGENAVAEFIPGTSGRAFSGLSASGTVLVEGLMTANYNGVRGFLRSEGTLEVASGGILRGTNAARFGDSSTTAYRIRGTAELADGARIDARTEVLGGTVRATSGRGELFVTGGGILRNATLDAAGGATLIVQGNYELRGALSGSPQGEVYVYRSALTAATAGATLGVTGTGLRFGFPTGSQFPTVLTGGPVTNTGRLVLAPSNFFSGIRGTTLTNDGALVLEGDLSMADGAVVRNRPGGVLTMVGSQIYQNPNTGVVRVLNEGLILREDPGGSSASRFLAVTLESLPGSEIRTLGDYLDLTAGPNENTLAPGTTLTGDGDVIFGPQPVRATISPGTDAEPIGSLGPRTFDQLVLAPQALTVLDVGADGVSDKLVDLDSFGGASITLGGRLRVRPRPGYTPTPGDSWTIGVNGSSNSPIQGAFTTIETPGAAPGISYVVDTSVPNRILLRAVALVSVGSRAQHVLEGQAGTFILSHPALPEPYTINVELGGTATLFSDYSIGASRGIIRTRPNSVNTSVQAFMRSDLDSDEGEETLTMRVVPGQDVVPGSQPEGLIRIQDGPSVANLSVNGIAPASGANAGLVTAIVYGTALSDGLDIRLTGPATIVGTAIAAFPQAGGVRVTFDLRNQPPGLYDVVVTGSDGVATLVQGFGVLAPGVEFPIWAAVNGTAAPRLGRDSRYIVTIGNDGLVDVFDVLVTIRVNGAGEYTVEQASVLAGAEDEPEGIEIEDQDIIPIYVYRIPAGGHVQVTMRLRPDEAGQPLGVTHQLHRPNPKAAFTTSGDFADLAEDSGNGLVTYWGLMGAYMETFLAGAMSPPGATGGALRGGDVCLPRPSDLDDFDPADLVAGAGATDTVSEVGARAFANGSDILVQPDGAAGLSAHELVHSAQEIGRRLDPQATPQEVEAAARRTVRNLMHDAATRIRSNAPFARASSVTTTEGGPLGITEGCAGGIVGAPADPNDKLGPFGVGADRFVRSSTGDVPYTIRFENLPTASFPAQEVIVVDSLDTAVFDLSTFGFGPIRWGENRRLTPPAGAKAFEAVVDLSPEIPARLLVTAGLDEASGRVEWHFVTLNPDNDELPEDGTVGFLPPNMASPEGEGALQFTVRTLDGLPSGTEIRNVAEIVFDVNEPILTPVWSNLLDDVAPVSSVDPLGGAEANPITLTLSGSDAGSGIAATIVYASQDGGAFQAVGVSEDGTFAFEGEEGSTYGFYARAYDRVDNLEGPKTEAEATTTVVVAGEDGPDLPLVLTLEAPRPNPARGLLRLRYGLPAAGAARVRVLDALGREVAVLAAGEAAAGWHTAEWTPGVASGVYVVEVRTDDAVRHRRLTVIR